MKFTAYILMLFGVGADGPKLVDAGIYSEPTPTQKNLVTSFFAEIAQADGRSYSEAAENVIGIVAAEPSMTWLRQYLRPEERVIFDRKVEERRQMLSQIGVSFRSEFR